jgi:hypothetical protein
MEVKALDNRRRAILLPPADRWDEEAKMFLGKSTPGRALLEYGEDGYQLIVSLLLSPEARRGRRVYASLTC